MTEIFELVETNAGMTIAAVIGIIIIVLCYLALYGSCRVSGDIAQDEENRLGVGKARRS